MGRRFGAGQSFGCGIHSARSKNVTFTTTMHPICWMPVEGAARKLRRIFSKRACISSKEQHPFACPKHSHANHSGKAEYRAKYPKPAIALCGAFSLKRNGEKSGARNVQCADGVQKFTSSQERRLL